MARERKPHTEPDLASLVGTIAQDTERLLGLHIDLLRAELREDLQEVGRAVGSMGAGAGLVALGGVMGTLSAVHGLHQATRMPLWKCYGIVGGLIAAAGAGMLATGAHRVASVSLVPRQTIDTLKGDLSWLKDQAKIPES